MATENWSKSGKHGSKPGTETKPKSQKLGSPYSHRQTMLGGSRTRELEDNDYGKKAQKKSTGGGGKRVDPRRTTITGASPKLPILNR